MAKIYWKTTAPSVTAKTPNTHAMPSIGSRIPILLRPVLIKTKTFDIIN